MYTDKDLGVICSIRIKWSQVDFGQSPLFTGHGYLLFVEYVWNLDRIRCHIQGTFKVPNSCASYGHQYSILKMYSY